MRLAEKPARRIIHAEALGWLAANPAEPRTSVITSLPDVSEVQLGLDAWRVWFMEAARRVIRWVPGECVSNFFQSDIRDRGTWIDKGYLVQSAAEDEGASLVWHKIVCRRPARLATYGRSSYSHMLCISRVPRDRPRHPSADVLPGAGFMPWTRAMGVEACQAACRYLREETDTAVVVDPFCGHGTVLAVANTLGLDALGIDLSSRKCAFARNLEFA